MHPVMGSHGFRRKGQGRDSRSLKKPMSGLGAAFLRAEESRVQVVAVVVLEKGGFPAKPRHYVLCPNSGRCVQ